MRLLHSQLRSQRLIIGFANGCFDLLHEGHRHFLTECRRNCTYLIVALNSDDYCRFNKGPDRPYNALVLRMLHVRSFAEAVVPLYGRYATPTAMIDAIQPDVVFRGYDQDLWLVPCQLSQISHLPGFSTTLAAHGRKADAKPEPQRQP